MFGLRENNLPFETQKIGEYSRLLHVENKNDGRKNGKKYRFTCRLAPMIYKPKPRYSGTKYLAEYFPLMELKVSGVKPSRRDLRNVVIQVNLYGP